MALRPGLDPIGVAAVGVAVERLETWLGGLDRIGIASTQRVTGAHLDAVSLRAFALEQRGLAGAWRHRQPMPTVDAAFDGADHGVADHFGPY